PEFCRKVKDAYCVKIFKAFPVKTDGTVHAGATLAEYAGVLDGLLLDTYDPEYGGGSGITFHWAAAEPYRQWAIDQGVPFLAAGGLHPDNVEVLIETLQPDGVDVSSGVETDGVKDIAKMTAFVERVKG
ncbi:MAG: phosphoribosylanthranilate isomerase, partial [Paenibacillaceae bacterium]|nr:phosphoribosylanthranilate isomerase [Paenibacillaceae bacterium]